MSSKALKRIEKELNEMEKEPPSNCTAGPKNRNNMYEWEATIIGPSNSPYAGGIFKLNVMSTGRCVYGIWNRRLGANYYLLYIIITILYSWSNILNYSYE